MKLKGITFKKIISFLLISAITMCVMPFNHIKADELIGTYNEYIAETCTAFKQWSTTRIQGYIFNKNGRIVTIKTSQYYSGNRYLNVYVTLDSSSKYTYETSSNNSASCPVTPNYNQGLNNSSYSGVRYYYIMGDIYPSQIPEGQIIIENNSITESSSYQYAYRYAYGDLKVDPEPPAPPVQAGELTVNYYTDFASTQQYTIGALKSNRDTIKWSYDSTNSNIELLDLKVDIRAVPNNYYSSTENGLESLGWGDIHLDTSYASDLGSYQINNNQVSYTWESVVNNFKMHTNLPEWFDNVINFWSNGFYKFYNNQYYAAGWVYQIRLNTWSGDYTGEWQTIYTVPSSPPEGQQTTIEYYVNGTGMTEPVYQNIQNINNQNNITNNTWYVNGSPYGVDDETGGNWFTKLLEILAGLVSDIISAITGLFGDVFSGIFDLIKSLGVDLLSVFTNLITWFRDLIGSIDLTGQNYILPEEYTQSINTFSSWTNGVLSILFNSGFGLIVLVPFVLFIVGLFL